MCLDSICVQITEQITPSFLSAYSIQAQTILIAFPCNPTPFPQRISLLLGFQKQKMLFIISKQIVCAIDSLIQYILHLYSSDQ